MSPSIMVFRRRVIYVNEIKVEGLVGVIGWCILMDLKIQTKSSVIGSTILKYVLKSCVIRLMIHKF